MDGEKDIDMVLPLHGNSAMVGLCRVMLRANGASHGLTQRTSPPSIGDTSAESMLKWMLTASPTDCVLLPDLFSFDIISSYVALTQRLELRPHLSSTKSSFRHLISPLPLAFNCRCHSGSKTFLGQPVGDGRNVRDRISPMH